MVNFSGSLTMSKTYSNSENHKTSKVFEVIEVKSKFDAEFRRFGLRSAEVKDYDEFYKLLETLHGLVDIPFVVHYTDPKDGDYLPINNDHQFVKSLTTASPVLRIVVQRKEEFYENGYYKPTSTGAKLQKKTRLQQIISGESKSRERSSRIPISLPEDFHRVSSIVDVDIVPETHRRINLIKHKSDKPLGFYIRDGYAIRVTSNGVEKVPGIFISRLVPGGLAESTGLLSVNDEVIEVNGIEVAGKSLDQVTDMMVANSHNLIITVKPANQKYNIVRGGSSRTSQASNRSTGSYHSAHSSDPVDSDTDEVREHLNNSSPEQGNSPAQENGVITL